jgi:hypothetical protein
MGRTEIDSLLAVQKRRADRAMDQVRARNQFQNQMEIERNRAHALLLETRSRRQQEAQRRDGMLANQTQHRVSLSEIMLGVRRVEWWDSRVAEYVEVLASADRALNEARLAAAEARHEYQQIWSRYEALLNLANEQRRAFAESRLRLEECATEDLIGNIRTKE